MGVVGARISMIVRAQLRVLFVGLAWAFITVTVPTQAEPLRATPGDRAVVEACLKLVDANAEKEAQGKSEDGSPGAAGRLAAAAKDAATQRESCIGAITIPCQQERGGASTMGMIDCNTREWAVWDERLNRLYREALKDAPAKLARALRDAQRVWLQWREKRCELPAIDNEGGSIVGPLYTGCMLDATARQALWLEHRG
jgi:uncharacterized protein YecT (DUF1311 family)